MILQCGTWFSEYQFVNAMTDPFSLFKFMIFFYVNFLESTYIHSLTYIPYNITVFCMTELRLKVYLL